MTVSVADLLELAAAAQRAVEADVEALRMRLSEAEAEAKLWRDLAALGPYAERPALPTTIGSQLADPRPNPHYRPPPPSRPLPQALVRGARAVLIPVQRARSS